MHKVTRLWTRVNSRKKGYFLSLNMLFIKNALLVTTIGCFKKRQSACHEDLGKLCEVIYMCNTLRRCKFSWLRDLNLSTIVFANLITFILIIYIQRINLLTFNLNPWNLMLISNAINRIIWYLRILCWGSRVTFNVILQFKMQRSFVYYPTSKECKWRWMLWKKNKMLKD